MIKKYTATAMIAIALVAGLSAASVTPALAVGPTSVTRSGGLHFVGTPDVEPTKTSTSAFLTATGEVAGAGTTATATLAANVDIKQFCINNGGGNPVGLRETHTTAAGQQTFDTRSGRGTFSVQTNPVAIPGGFTCPSNNMTPHTTITFTGITLTITSGGKTATATFPNIDP